ncbi:MAG: PqqD family protein, partial [Acidimicrobiales bacterium]
MKPANDVLVHREEGTAFLLHVASGRYFGLNRTGLVIWEALVAGDDPAAALLERWPDLDSAACAADVDALVGELL